MPTISILRTFIILLLAGFIGFLPLPATALSLQEAIRASLGHSKAIAAARQNWIATRDVIGSNTSTSDLSARLTSKGTLAKTNERDGRGFSNSQSLANGVTLSKNLYDGGQTRENVRLAQINLESKDYYTLTKRIMILAKELCGEKIVSILEGGYDLTALKESVDFHIKSLVENK